MKKNYSASCHKKQILKSNVDGIFKEKDSQNTKKSCLFYSAIGNGPEKKPRWR